MRTIPDGQHKTERVPRNGEYVPSAAHVEWARKLIRDANDGAIWAVPRSGDTFRIDHAAKTVTRVLGREEDIEPLIWWTNQKECEAAVALLRVADTLVVPWEMPDYLRGELSSRAGRNDRGRLWVNSEVFPETVEVSPRPQTPLGNLLGETSGGIAIRGEDLAVLRRFRFPGVVTDLKLNEVHGKGKKVMATTYTTAGSVRGTCGHRHRTLRTATKCLARDQRACQSQHGYSDRVVCYGDGSRLNDRDFEVWKAMDP